ncbi:hypothetical protein OG753_39180 [Streptomyces sp. NBC_00029]|uniref:hypothetical protein n=1 Tax=Streptomyces sp. NBC_00029 TaxID=2903613 RepID=UPI00324E070C
MTTPHHPAGHTPVPGNPYSHNAGGGGEAAYAPAPGGHAPSAYAGPAPAAGQASPPCRACGARIAVNFKVRAHMGILIMMKFEHLDGPFCRACGIAVVRQMTFRTLFLGWWGPLSLVILNPFTLVWNLTAYLKYSKLPPSAPLPGRAHLDTGPPVLRRPLSYVALIPLAWAIWVVTQIVTHEM